MTSFLVVATIVVSVDPNWAEILKDHQATSQATLRQGRARLALSYRRGDARPALVDFDVAWSGHVYAQKLRVHDPDGITGAAGGGDDRPLDRKPWSLAFSTEKEYVTYSPERETMDIYHPVQPRLTPLMDLTPYLAWLHASPPTPSRERPWPTLIGAYPARPKEGPPRFEFRREADRVMQIRSDRDGGRQEIVFSLADGGNVVELRSFKPRIFQATHLLDAIRAD